MASLALALAFALTDPQPGDVRRFGPTEVIQAGREFNRRYREHLSGRLEWEPYPANRAALRAALAEANELYEVWDSALWAHPDFAPAWPDKAGDRRRLRLLLGPAAYRRGELPPPAPYWRFNQLER